MKLHILRTLTERANKALARRKIVWFLSMSCIPYSYLRTPYTSKLKRLLYEVEVEVLDMFFNMILRDFIQGSTERTRQIKMVCHHVIYTLSYPPYFARHQMFLISNPPYFKSRQHRETIQVKAVHSSSSHPPLRAVRTLNQDSTESTCKVKVVSSASMRRPRISLTACLTCQREMG